MENEIIKTEAYKSWISQLKIRYRQAQIKASVAVNSELLKFYFELGKDIAEKQFTNTYGSSFYKTLSTDLIAEFPESKGFSPTNLKYAFYFYDLYKTEVQNRQQVVDDLYVIPWGHHVQIIGKCRNDSKKALFYVSQTLQNNWSRNVLLNFIDSNLYERQGKAVTNFSQKLPIPTGDLAQQITKDPYSFDFLSLRTDYDNPTLGILICKDKDNVLAKYSLESSAEPLAVSEYELAKLYPANFKSTIPTIEELEDGIK